MVQPVYTVLRDKTLMASLETGSVLRKAIEVAKIILNRTDERLANLARTPRPQNLKVKDKGFQRFLVANFVLHALILALTGLSKVASAAEQISFHLHRARMLILPEHDRHAETFKKHQSALDVRKASDADAARSAMSRHLCQLITRIASNERQHAEFFCPN